MKRPVAFHAAGAMAVLVLLAARPAVTQTPPLRAFSFQELLKGNDETELRWPAAAAAASADEVAVADAFGSRLLRFRRIGVSWQLDRVVTLRGAPIGLTWDGGRFVASLRQGRGLVALEGPELAQRPLPLPPGVVPGPLAADPNGNLLVYDYAGKRVLRLSGDADPAAEVEVAGEVTALAATRSGGFFAAVAAEGAVLRFDASGELEATWTLPRSEEIPPWPVGLAVEPGGTLVVVDRHAGRLLLLDAKGEVVGVGGRRGWEPGLLLFPFGITRLPDGLLLVADQGNGRAQIFRRIDSGPAP